MVIMPSEIIEVLMIGSEILRVNINVATAMTIASDIRINTNSNPVRGIARSAKAIAIISINAIDIMGDNDNAKTPLNLAAYATKNPGMNKIKPPMRHANT